MAMPRACGPSPYHVNPQPPASRKGVTTDLVRVYRTSDGAIFEDENIAKAAQLKIELRRAAVGDTHFAYIVANAQAILDAIAYAGYVPAPTETP